LDTTPISSLYFLKTSHYTSKIPRKIERLFSKKCKFIEKKRKREKNKGNLVVLVEFKKFSYLKRIFSSISIPYKGFDLLSSLVYFKLSP
jgi:hypothetical protein